METSKDRMAQGENEWTSYLADLDLSQEIWRLAARRNQEARLRAPGGLWLDEDDVWESNLDDVAARHHEKVEPPPSFVVTFWTNPHVEGTRTFDYYSDALSFALTQQEATIANEKGMVLA